MARPKKSSGSSSASPKKPPKKRVSEVIKDSDAAPVQLPQKYAVKVKMGDVELREAGATIFEALSKIKMNKVVGKVQITFSNGLKSHTMTYLRPIFFRRVLANDSVKTILEGRAKKFLGEK